MKFLTKKPILSVVAQAIMCGLVLSGCQGDENGVDFGKANQSDDKSVFDNGRRKTAEVDIEKECGLPPGAIANKSAVILQENLKSLPIVVSGSQMGTDFKVTTVANAQITGTTSSSTQVLNVDVTDTQAAGMTALFGQFLVKSKAKDAAAENSGRKTYNSLPQGEWLTLTNGSNPEFSNLLCAVTATKTVENH